MFEVTLEITNRDRIDKSIKEVDRALKELKYAVDRMDTAVYGKAVTVDKESEPDKQD